MADGFTALAVTGRAAAWMLRLPTVPNRVLQNYETPYIVPSVSSCQGICVTVRRKATDTQLHQEHQEAAVEKSWPPTAEDTVRCHRKGQGLQHALSRVNEGFDKQTWI